jgi:PAS domain S-box-containing protein
MDRQPAPSATGPSLLAAGPPPQSRAESSELAEVRAQLREARETIEAIRGGGIDSLVIGPPGQEQVYALASVDRPYQLIVKAMNEGAATVSPRGVILDANPRLGAMTGHVATELVGTAVLDLIPDGHRAAFARLLDVGVGDSARGEVDLTGPGSTTVPVLLAVSGFDLDGMFLRCLVLTDLTTQRAAEGQAAQAHEELREQNAFLEQAQDEIRAAVAYNRSLIEVNLNPMVMISPDGAITDVNTATEQATGYGRTELLGTEFSGYFTEPDLARDGYEQAFRDGSARDYPLELRHRDGHIISVLYNAAVCRDPSGQVLGVFAAARDITEVKRTQAALRESGERLRVLFENAPVGIGEVALSGELVRINSRFCQILGYTADEVLSRQFQDLVHPDDLDTDLASRHRLLAGELDTYSAERRFVQKDGGVVWAEVHWTLVRDPDGNPLVYVGAMRDITAQREAEAEVRALHAGLEARVKQRTADLERANKNLEAFTYSVSHDLRAPLRGLSGFSEVLLEDYGDRLDETGRGYARRIQAASEKMGILIDDLLHLSRESRASVNLGPVDLSAEVAAIAAELQSREPGRLVRFAIQDGVRVTADRTLIHTVVQNLIDNAWKFTARRDDATIEFGTTPADVAGICCYVRDNGAGFDPAYVDKLFQPFQRLHTEGEFTGTGIGLASVRRIVERHGGRTWAEGAVGSGATFYFTLDAQESGAAAG